MLKALKLSSFSGTLYLWDTLLSVCSMMMPRRNQALKVVTKLLNKLISY